MPSPLDTNQLTTILEYALSQPRAVGQQLRSERELADLLNTGLSRIKTSLGRLEKKGILERRHGSGTYIRRLAGPVDIDLAEAAVVMDKLENIFRDHPRGQANTPHRNTVHTRYHFGLWGDWHYTNPISQKIYGAIASLINQRGHRVTMFSVLKGYKQPFEPDEIAEQIEHAGCDGFILMGFWENRFKELMKSFSGAVVYFSTGSFPLKAEPLISFHTEEATQRGVSLLSDQGYQRIALMALDRLPLGKPRSEPTLYDLSLRRKQLDYRRELLISCDLGNIMKAVHSLLDEDPRPEAIYVADDTFLPGLVEVFNARGVVPGRDIGIITLSNEGITLPGDVEWSRLEFSAEEMARTIVNSLEDQLVNRARSAMSISIQAHWKPGTTHQHRE